MQQICSKYAANMQQICSKYEAKIKKMNCLTSRSIQYSSTGLKIFFRISYLWEIFLYFSPLTNNFRRSRSLPRWSRNGRGGFRGNRRGRGGFRQNQTQISKETLDAELDSYMADTKTVLDQELDDYMAQGVAHTLWIIYETQIEKQNIQIKILMSPRYFLHFEQVYFSSFFFKKIRVLNFS